MSDEAAFIAALRAIIRDPGARGLMDDAAVIAPPLGRELVVTHDMIAENIHFLPDDPPGDVAWKLLAVNLSDLAAKGARPRGVILGYTLSSPAWDQAFVTGLGRALEHFDVPLLGGDTIAAPARILGLTAFGEAEAPVPDRRHAKAGDSLWVAGTIGDAGLGLRIARGEISGPRRLLKAYRLPMPRLATGQAVARHVAAMADVSDGLLIDAARMAEASGLRITIDLPAVPLSPEAITVAGESREARIAACVAGDDYALIFASAASPEEVGRWAPDAVRVGAFDTGQGLLLRDKAEFIPLPPRLGWLHNN